MVDKLDSINRPPATGAGQKPVTTAKPSSGNAPARGDNADQLSLTDSAQALRTLQEAVADVPLVDELKVAEIKQALADGEYTIDAARIAAKLRELCRRTGDSFKAVVNRTLREGLAARPARESIGVFHVVARPLGLRPGLDLDDVEGLLEQIDGPEHK